MNELQNKALKLPLLFKNTAEAKLVNTTVAFVFNLGKITFFI